MSGLLVYSAGTGFDGIRGTDRQVADRLSEIVDVLYVDPPQSLLARPARSALTPVGPHLWRLSPAGPPGAHRPGVHVVTDALTRHTVRRAAARLGATITAIVASGTTDLYGAAPAARTLRYITDDLTAGAGLVGMSAARLARTERRLALRADGVAVVSPDLVTRVQELGRAATLVPNGCDVAAGAAVDEAPWPDDLPRDLCGAAGFVGHINDRIDIGLLEAVADTGRPLVLVGPVADGYEPERFPALVARLGVYWVGSKPYDRIPSYLRAIDVGLTPYSDNAFNRASFPLKTLEYLAAGRAVVTTELPATRWLNAGDLIRIAAGPARFAAAVASAPAPTPALTERRRRFAAAHDWNERVRVLANLAGVAVKEVTGR